MVTHLKRLGVTAVELLPIHSFVDDRHLVLRGLVKLLGLQHALILCTGAPLHTGRFRRFIETRSARRWHGCTMPASRSFSTLFTTIPARGNHLGPTLSLRGIDNASYYWLLPDQPRYYDDFTGCGNALNLTHPRVLQLVMDSLRYWVDVCHVDGFRFDLATTLARGRQGFDRGAAFFAAVKQDPVLADVKMIAEPWDIGPGGYQVGAFPSGWSEWNDRFRHTLRRYWAGAGNLIGDVGGRMTGSTDLFNHDGRGPRASINHVTVHDGFTPGRPGELCPQA